MPLTLKPFNIIIKNMDEERPMTKKEKKDLRHLEKLAGKSGGKSSDKMRWIIITVGSIIFIAFFAVIIYLIKQNQNKPVVLSASSGFVRGSAHAKATLVEFGDLQCPACRVYEPFVRQLMKDFNGKLKLVYKNFPLTSVHPNAMLAARAAVAAGEQGKFWQMHDWLYDNQDSWAGLSSPDARSKMLEEAKNLGLNIDQFNKDLDSKKTIDTITATQNEGINLGVAGTPTFFLNSKKLDNPQSYDEFKMILQNAVK